MHKNAKTATPAKTANIPITIPATAPPLRPSSSLSKAALSRPVPKGSIGDGTVRELVVWAVLVDDRIERPVVDGDVTTSDSEVCDVDSS